jgi:hypothetical protein
LAGGMPRAGQGGFAPLESSPGRPGTYREMMMGKSTKLAIEFSAQMLVRQGGDREAALSYWAKMNPLEQRAELLAILTDGGWVELEIVDAKISVSGQ